MKPSNFLKKFPNCSKIGKFEYEVVAYNIMRILAESGDSWRIISWVEYAENIELLEAETAKHREHKIFNYIVSFFIDEKTVRDNIGGFWKYI